MIWAAVAYAGARGVVISPPPRGLEEAYRSRRVALVVGIDQYTDPALGDLAFAAKDARDLAQVLSDPTLGDYEVVSVLAGDVPRQAFWDAFRAVTAHLQRDDTFVLYVAAHGTLDVGAGGTELFVLPTDAWLAQARTGGIAVAELADAVARLPAKRRVTILDSCHSAGGRSAVAPATRARIDSLRGPVPPPAALDVSAFEARLYAAHYNQPAIEDKALQNGVYSHYLVDGLRGAADGDGDGLVEVMEAHTWARDRTLEYTGGAQVPWAETTAVGREVLFLAGDPSRRKRAEHAIVAGLERLPANATLRVDGVPRGAGPLAPGRRELVVSDTDGPLAAARMKVRPGDTIDVAELVRARGPRTTLAAGLGIGPGGDVAPDFAASVSGWHMPADPGGPRLAFGVTASIGVGPIGTHGTWPAGTALARGAILWGERLAMGPILGAGLLWRLPPSGAQAGPLASVGLHAHANLGPLQLGLEPSLSVLALDDAPAWLPRVDLTFGHPF